MARRLFTGLILLIGLVAGIWWSYVASRLVFVQSDSGGSHTYTLLADSAIWFAPGAVLLGMFLGAADRNPVTLPDRPGLVVRHRDGTFFEHWTTALTTVILIVTGVMLGFLFVPRLIQGPEITGFTMNVHFIGAVGFLVATSYHLTNHLFAGDLLQILPKVPKAPNRRYQIGDVVKSVVGDITGMLAHYQALFTHKELPPEEKYMAGQRMAYLGFAVMVAALIVTGLAKVAAHAWSLPGLFKATMTVLHDLSALGMIVLLIIHLIVGSIMPVSWPLLKSMFTGYVPEEYVRSHHALWYRQLHEQQKLHGR